MQKKKLFKAISAVLCGCLIGTSIVPGMSALKVKAQESTDSEWKLVSSILDSYPGIYTEDTRFAEPWNTNRSPDGPLMGNGTVYAYMAGDQKTQNLYITHSNMWQDKGEMQEYTTFGGVTIQPFAGENLALNKDVTVCSQTKESEGGAYMVDGKLNTKWCTTPSDNEGITDHYWAVIDLGENLDISRWVVKHAQEGGETSEFNTKDFKLQYYEGEDIPDGAVDEDWKDVDAVKGNTEAVTDRNLENPINARYVRLLITKATQSENNAVRIPELELYAESSMIQEDAQEFQYVQDMKNAEVTAQSRNGFTTVNWLSAKENILVTEITNVTENNLPLEVTAWTANANTNASVEGNRMIATKTGISEPNEEWPFADGTWQGWTVNVAMASQVIGDVEVTTKNIDEHKNSSAFILEPGQKVTVVSAIEGGKEENQRNSLEQVINKASAKLDTRLTQEELEASKQKHRDYWKEYWLKSYIDIQDEEVERMYYGMLYQLGCATSISSENNGGIPTGLYPWTSVDHPAWQGDYTTNTDFQRQIHPLMVANRTEGIENYLNIIEQFWPDAIRRSESVQDLNWVIEGTGRPEFTEGIKGGALIPTHIGPWGAATERKYSSADYWKCPSDATAVLMPVIKEWKYTLDEDLLDRLYPMMKSVSIFWENYVTLEDGKYVVYGATHENIAGRNAILDVDACKYMLKNTILAANELGVDQDKVKTWQNIIDNMSPVPTFMYNGKETICDVEGRTQANPGYTFNSNPVTIQSVYYYDSIGMTASDEEKEKYINYLNVGNGRGSHRRLISATRLGYDINEVMGQLKSSSIHGNLGYDYGMRGNNTIGDIGKVANLAIIQDSLIQSNEGFINIFANWYDNQETSFRRLRTENAFLVDADMDAFGQVTYAKIHSEKGRECSVLNPWKNQEMEVYEDGQKVEITSTEENSLGTVYTFDTKAGADYELKPVGGLKGVLRLDKETLELEVRAMDKLSAVTDVENPTFVWSSENPEVAVVGNDGTVLALKEGETVVRVSIPEKDLVAECKITVKPAADLVNVAPYGIATASDYYENFTPDRAINGEWTSSYEGWVSRYQPSDSEKVKWLQIDLGQEYTIERWLLRHEGWRQGITEDQEEGFKDNRGNYYLQVSPDGVNDWQTVDAKMDNKNNTTDRTLETPVTGRYFRIYVEYPMLEGSGFIRLHQVELYTKAEAQEDIKVTEVQNPGVVEAAYGTAFEELSLPTAVTVKLSNDMSVNFPVSWEKGNYDGNTSGEYTLNGTLQLPEGITNEDNLTATVKVKVNAPLTDKELLQKTYDYALTLNTDGVTDSAKAFFEKVLAEAKAVLDNADVTQEEINTAWDNLLEGIKGLGIVQGDKTNLGLLIDRADAMVAEQERYVETNWQKLVDALDTAKAVMSDGDATPDVVKEAADNLLNAILVQRYKANKDNLEDLIKKAEALDLSKYTDESVIPFKAALEEAKNVMEDETLSVDDQEKVDQAAAQLDEMMKALQPKEDSGDEENGNSSGNKGDNNNTGNSENNSGNENDNGTRQPRNEESQDPYKPVQTGDTSSVLFPVMGIGISVIALMIIGVILVKRKSK